MKILKYILSLTLVFCFGCAEDDTDSLERSPLTSRSMAWVAHLPSVVNGSYGHYYETLIDE